jgi:hypothetical protein
MREFLLTKFVCAQCGSNLEISSERPKLGSGRHSHGEPTGSDMLEQLVPINPCRSCMEPLAKMQDAANVLLSFAKAKT